MKVLSFGDLDLSDNGDYRAWFPSEYGPADNVLTAIGQDAGAPVVVPGGEAPLQIVLRVMFYHDAGAAAKRRELLAAFDTRGGAKALVVADDDGSRPRYALCHTRQIVPLSGGGQYEYIVTLLLDEDNQWRGAAETRYDLTWTESNTTQVVTNSGELEAYPVITITPRQAKSSSEGFIYSRRVIFEGPQFFVYDGAPLPQPPPFPAHVGFTLDTEALLDDGKVTGANDMALLHGNGRWDLPVFASDSSGYGFNAEETKFWINHLNFQTQPYFALAEPIAEDAVLTRIRIDVSSIDATPEQLRQMFNRWGMMYAGPWSYIRGEIFIFEGYDEITHELLNVRRAQCGTAAQAHSSDNAVYTVSSVNLRLLYGPAARIAEPELTNTIRARREPIIDLDESTNARWVYNLFKRDGRDPASTGWVVNRTEGADPMAIFTRESDSSGAIGAGGNERLFYPWNTLGFAAGRQARTAYRIHFGRVIDTLALEARYVNGASYSQHPNLPALVATHPQSSARVIVWQPVSPTYSNTLRSVSVSVPTLAAQQREELLPTSLAFECNTSTYCQTDIQKLAVQFYPFHGFYTAFGPEVALYDLRLKITNETTGESLLVDAPMGETDMATVVDCANHTAIHDGYDNIYGRVKRMGTDSRLRQHFLRLVPGDNVIRVEDPGLTDVDVTFEFRARYYA